MYKSEFEKSIGIDITDCIEPQDFTSDRDICNADSAERQSLSWSKRVEASVACSPAILT